MYIGCFGVCDCGVCLWLVVSLLFWVGFSCYCYLLCFMFVIAFGLVVWFCLLLVVACWFVLVGCVLRLC